MVVSPGLARRAGRAALWKGLEIAGNRGFSLLRTVVLARLLVPEDFGLLAAGVVTMDVGVQVTTFGMREAVIQRRELDRDHYDAAWTFELVRTAVVAGILMLAAPLIATQMFGEPRATNVIRALTLAPLLDRAGSIGALTLVRQLRFGPVAAVGLVASIVHASVAIALSHAFGVWAMVIGHLTGVLAQTAGSYVIAPHWPRFSFRLEAARPLLHFGRGVFARQVIDVLGGTVLQVVIARRLGTAELGLYFVAARFAFLPREIFRTIGTQVAFPVHAELQLDRDRAERAFRGHLAGTWLLLVPLYAVAIALAPALMAHLVGTRWMGAVGATRVLALAAMIGPLCDTAMPALLGRGRSEVVAMLVAGRSIAIASVAWPLAGALGLTGACLAWLLGEVLSAVFVWGALRDVLPSAFKGLTVPGLVIVAAATAGTVVAVAAERALHGLPGVIVAVALSVAASSATLLVLDRRLRLGLVQEMARALPGTNRLLRLGVNDAGVA
jgi:O-antigen/teichoic acid export membrane protein